MSGLINPALSRTQNLLVVAPPAPAYAARTLAVLIEQHPRPEDGFILVLAPPASIAEWSSLCAGLDGAVRAVVATGIRQATRALGQEGSLGLLVVTPAIAVTLRERSALAPTRVGAVLAAWPELWEDVEALTVVLQDVSRETPRAIVTSDPAAIQGVVDRHAWRAATGGDTAASLPPAGPVRTVPVSWGRRLAVLPELIERLDPDSLSIWTVGDTRHAEIARAVAGSAIPVAVAAGAVEPADHVIAFDLPTGADLARLLAAGNVTLLVPPGTETWIARIAAPRTPLILSALLDSADADLTRRRAAIDRAVRDGPLWPGQLALAPLFERHDPAAVAAALYGLWSIPPAKPAPAPEPRETGDTVRIWVGAGRRDKIGVSDLVGMLLNELKVERASIGKIDLRESFSLVEVPAAAAERIASALGGRTLRGRRLTARVDRKGPS